MSADILSVLMPVIGAWAGIDFWGGLVDAVSRALGSLLMGILTPFIYVLGHILQFFLLLVGYLLALVFNFAFGLMSSAIVLDIGAVFGFNHFPSPSLIATFTKGDFMHILVVITNDPNIYVNAVTAVNPYAVVVPISGVFFEFVRGVVMGSFVLVGGLMFMSRILSWVYSESASDLDLLASIPEVLFAIIFVFLAYYLVVLIGLMPYATASYLVYYFSQHGVQVVSANGGLVLETTNSIAGMFSTLANALAAASGTLALSGTIGLGGAIAWAISFLVLVLGTIFVFGSVMLAIILAPAWVFVKRVLLGLIGLVFFPFAFIDYAVGGRGGGSHHPVLSRVLGHFVKGLTDALGGLGKVAEEYIEHCIGFSFGMVILVLILELINAFANSVSQTATMYFNQTAGLFLTVARKGGAPLPEGVALLYKGIALMFIALVVVVIFAFLMSKLKDLDRIGSSGFLEFGRMEMLIGENIRRAINMVMTGLAFAAVPVAGGAVAVAGTTLSALGSALATKTVAGVGALGAIGTKFGGFLALAGSKLAGSSAVLASSLLGSGIVSRLGVSVPGHEKLVEGYREELSRLAGVSSTKKMTGFEKGETGGARIEERGGEVSGGEESGEGGGASEEGEKMGGAEGRVEVGSLRDFMSRFTEVASGEEITLRSLLKHTVGLPFAMPFAMLLDNFLGTRLTQRIGESAMRHYGKLIGIFHVNSLRHAVRANVHRHVSEHYRRAAEIIGSWVPSVKSVTEYWKDGRLTDVGLKALKRELTRAGIDYGVLNEELIKHFAERIYAGEHSKKVGKEIMREVSEALRSMDVEECVRRGMLDGIESYARKRGKSVKEVLGSLDSLSGKELRELTDHVLREGFGKILEGRTGELLTKHMKSFAEELSILKEVREKYTNEARGKLGKNLSLIDVHGWLKAEFKRLENEKKRLLDELEAKVKEATEEYSRKKLPALVVDKMVENVRKEYGERLKQIDEKMERMRKMMEVIRRRGHYLQNPERLNNALIVFAHYLPKEKGMRVEGLDERSSLGSGFMSDFTFDSRSVVGRGGGG